MEDGNGQIALESIPGLGIIRIRSLRKAGLNDCDALRRVTAEQIAEVPGISLEKAQAILEYLKIDATPAPRIKRRRVPALAIVEPPPESLHEAVVRVAERAESILAGERALDFERALARQIARVVAIKEQAAGAASLSDKKCNRLKKSLEQLDATLGKIDAANKLKGKKQTRLADDLREARREAADLLENGLA